MNGWRRVSKGHCCPVCGKGDWCMVSEDGTAAICPRTPDGAVRDLGEAGYLHELAESRPRRVRRRRAVQIGIDAGEQPPPKFAQMSAGWAAATKIEDLLELSDELGVSPESLTRLGVGWAQQHRAWSFPMRDARGLVRGIRLRGPSGAKWSVKGGREGLFLPSGLADVDGLDIMDMLDITSEGVSPRLLVCEGPTDCAALLDLGFAAVGRPSCTGGTRLLVELVRMRQVQEVIIFADADGNGAGQRGAESLGSVLVTYVPAVRIVYPPAGVKDVRQWKQDGATPQDVQAAIEAAQVHRLRAG